MGTKLISMEEATRGTMTQLQLWQMVADQDQDGIINSVNDITVQGKHCLHNLAMHNMCIFILIVNGLQVLDC